MIRGPLGAGKTTVARRVARAIGAEYVSIDRILDDRGLWYSGRLSEFLRANRFAAARAAPWLARGVPVVFDGNFYWKAQIADLVARLDRPPYVFTLRAPRSLCIARDAARRPSHGRAAVIAVYAKSTRFASGRTIDATGSAAAAVRAVVARLPERVAPGRSRRRRTRTRSSSPRGRL